MVKLRRSLKKVHAGSRSDPIWIAETLRVLRAVWQDRRRYQEAYSDALRDALVLLDSRIQAERERDALHRTCGEVERVLAAALGWSVYGAEGPGNEGEPVMGEHVTESVADAAAAEIGRLRVALSDAITRADAAEAEVRHLQVSAQAWKQVAGHDTALARLSRRLRGQRQQAREQRRRADKWESLAHHLIAGAVMLPHVAEALRLRAESAEARVAVLEAEDEAATQALKMLDARHGTVKARAAALSGALGTALDGWASLAELLVTKPDVQAHHEARIEALRAVLHEGASRPLSA